MSYTNVQYTYERPGDKELNKRMLNYQVDILGRNVVSSCVPDEWVPPKDMREHDYSPVYKPTFAREAER